MIVRTEVLVHGAWGSAWVNRCWHVSFLAAFSLLMSSVGCSKSEPAPLIFSASGRLSEGIHGFTLGMSVLDALRVDPKLENFDYSKASPASSWLWSNAHDGFTDQLSFVRGRLILIASTGANVSPSQAAEFESSLSIYGVPDRVITSEPLGRHWIWIDRDVRLVYTSHPIRKGEPASPRYLLLQSAIYPAYISALESARASANNADELISQVRRDFGDGKADPGP